MSELQKISPEARAALQAKAADIPAVLAGVKIEPWLDHNNQPSGLSVHPVWAGVDRPDSGGWVVSNQKVADRLATAIADHAIWTSVHVGVDVFGQTYVITEGTKVLARMMNADLKRLGY